MNVTDIETDEVIDLPVSDLFTGIGMSCIDDLADANTKEELQEKLAALSEHQKDNVLIFLANSLRRGEMATNAFKVSNWREGSAMDVWHILFPNFKSE